MHKHLILAIFVTLLWMTLVSPIVDMGTIRTESPSRISTAEFDTVDGYTDHGPILINADDDFDIQGWPGSGTENDPYRIEELNITRDQTCINITGTRKHFVIQDCIISSIADNETDGIMLENVTNGMVKECYITKKDNALAVWDTNDTIVMMNEITDSDDAIEAVFTWNVEVSFNEVYGNKRGIATLYCISCRFVNNTIYDNQYAGCSPDGYGYGSVFANNTIYGHRSPYGIMGYASAFSSVWSFGWTITENTIYDNGMAFDLWDVSDWLISDNIISDTSNPVSCLTCSNITITDNNITGGSTAINLQQSEKCSIESNRIQGSLSAVAVHASIEMKIIDNIMDDAGIYITGLTLSEWRHEISGNTINEKNLGYFYSDEGSIIDGDDYAQVFLVNCTDTSLEEGEFHNSTIGVTLAFCEGVTVRGAQIYHEKMGGISIYESEDCVITESELYENGYTHGYFTPTVDLSSSEAIVISSNIIRNNRGTGISLWVAANCTITDNAIYNNTVYGISLETRESIDNIIYGNAIGWNVMGNAQDNGRDNQWDDGTSIGNWWSDYNTTDEVYNIEGEGDSVDRYPNRLTDRNPAPPIYGLGFDLIFVAAVITGVAFIVIVIGLIVRSRRGV